MRAGIKAMLIILLTKTVIIIMVINYNHQMHTAQEGLKAVFDEAIRVGMHPEIMAAGCTHTHARAHTHTHTHRGTDTHRYPIW